MSRPSRDDDVHDSTIDVADQAARKLIAGSLIAYNETHTGRNDYRPIVIAIDDESGQVIGGLVGRTAFDWLLVELSFVPESLRDQGVGADVMRRAEAEASESWLTTRPGPLGISCARR